ncbi:MAG TPA: 4-(cytidine 5'-diphospho)-2-C-methyl-D-erythritol kinase [Steroidobacteraceae bacterium]|nr:4-(cytidine 5'-diphospho)-2-C-methyl-D-erythritol kinase [Steroidobacteraceae bacterium]
MSAPHAQRERWPAPAKLNLFLHITGRRADGYHTLQTAFQLIDLADSIEIEATSDCEIRRLEGPDGVPAEADLAVRAARALQVATTVRRGARLRIEKRIPVGAGLGGGSSDAATTLVALNELWGTGLDLRQLASIGADLGADVPLFIHGRSAFAEGIGDLLMPLELPEKWFLVVYPGVAVATAAVFQSPELTRNSPLITIRDLFGAETHNDCEPVVRARFPAVGEALDWLGQFAGARLTGTGSCVFASFDSASAAGQVAAKVPQSWRSYVARGLNHSPLHAQLARLRGESE